jgi:hypothetical protein
MRLARLFLPLFWAWLALVAVNEIERHFVLEKAPPAKERMHPRQTTNRCGWACHDGSANCPKNHPGLPMAFRRVVQPAHDGFIVALKATGAYQLANLAFIAFLWPLALSAALAGMGVGHRVPWWGVAVTWVATGAAVAGVVKWADPYTYLTDGVLTLAHWTGWSYFDVNALIFIVIWPAFSVVAAIWAAWKLFSGQIFRRRP